MNDQTSRGPDFGFAKVLRGFPNFEDYYQGLSRGKPIALSLFGSVTSGRDAAANENFSSLAGKLGKQTAGVGPAADGNVDGITSPDLLEGVPVSLGADVVFALPAVANAIYKITWRLRSVDFYEKTKIPYHSSLESYRYTDTAVSTQNGANPDTVFAGKAAQRAVIATFEENIRVTQAASTTIPALGQQNVKDLILDPLGFFQFIETITVGELAVPVPESPILPFVGGNANINPVTGKKYVSGEYGQSPLVQAINDGSEGGTAFALQNRTRPTHVTYTTKAKADECIVSVYASSVLTDPTNPGVYDFDGADQGLSICFGRGGYEGPFNASGVLFPKGVPFGAYLIQGFGG